MSPEHDRRRFHRFPFRADCELMLEGRLARSCALLDLSINGALIELAKPEDFNVARDAELMLSLRGLTNGSQADIVLNVRAVRVEDRRVACCFAEVDADSFERLKNLIADNLGDLSLLDRELTQLDYWPGLPVSASVG